MELRHPYPMKTTVGGDYEGILTGVTALSIKVELYVEHNASARRTPSKFQTLQ